MCWLLLYVVSVLSALGVGSKQPFVSWSMDNHTGTELFPNFNSDPRWIGDIGPLQTGNKSSIDIFSQGVFGDAIIVESNRFRIAKNLTGTDCVANQFYCRTGLSLTFWINLRSWRNDSSQTVMSTNTGKVGIKTGIHVWLENGTLKLHALPGVDELHYLSVDATAISHRWTHVGLTWNKMENTSNLFINGSQFSSKIGNHSSSYENLANVSGPSGDFEIGSPNGPSFYLDDLEIFYCTLDHDEMELLADIPRVIPLPRGHTGMKVDNILMATVIPVAVMVILIGVCIYFARRRARKSFRSYLRQSSRNVEEPDPDAIYSDAVDEHTDIDSDAELEKLHNRLINRA